MDAQEAIRKVAEAEEGQGREYFNGYCPANGYELTTVKAGWGERWREPRYRHRMEDFFADAHARDWRLDCDGKTLLVLTHNKADQEAMNAAWRKATAPAVEAPKHVYRVRFVHPEGSVQVEAETAEEAREIARRGVRGVRVVKVEEAA